MPENLQTLLETGELPEEAGYEEPLPPEVLEGLPLPMVNEVTGEAEPVEEPLPEEVPVEPAPEEEPVLAYGLRRVR